MTTRILPPETNVVDLLAIVAFLNDGHSLAHVATEWQLNPKTIYQSLYRAGYRARTVWEIPQ